MLGISGSITGSINRLAASIGGDADLEVSGVTEAGFDEALLGTITSDPNVKSAVPLLRMQVAAGPDRALLLGVGQNIGDLHSDLQTAVHDAVQGLAPLPSAPNGVIVGKGVGVSRGEQFHLESTEVTAAAVVDGPAARRLNGGHFVVAPLALAQQISGREQRLDSILIFAAPGAYVDQVRSGIIDRVSGRAIVATPSFRAAQAGSSFAILQAMTLLAASVSLVVAAFLSYNAMSIAIAQRRPMISTMRALGGRRRTIVSDMLAEAALISFAGALIGCVGGAVVGRAAVSRLPATLVQSLDARVEYVLSPLIMPTAIAACVVASVTASALAARQIYAVSPIEALAPIGATTSEVGSRSIRIGAGIAGVVMVAATILVVTADVGRAAVASIALAFVGAGALCFAFSRPIVRWATSVAQLFGAPGVLGAATIERAPRRMWVAMMTVLTAVVTTIAVSGATNNAVDSTVASFSSVGDVDIWVSSTPVTEPYPTAPLPSDTESKVAALPGVAKVVPAQFAFATVGDTRIMLLGVAPGSHQDIYRSMPALDRDKLLSGEGVALSRDLGRALNVSVGDKLTLQTPSGPRQVDVLQLVPYFSGLTGTMAISLKTMQEWFSIPDATYLEVAVTPGTDPKSVESAIRNTISKDAFVYSGKEALAGVRGTLNQVIAIIRIIAWIVVIVSAVTLLNTFMLTVMDRRREIGVLRAIGATRRFTRDAIIAEALAVGTVGGALGIILGTAIQYLICVALTNVLSIPVNYHTSPTLIIVGLSAIGICLLGAILPAVRASRLNIIEAVSTD